MREGLPDGVVPAGGGMRVQEELGGGGPEGGGELEEHFCVGAHCECCDGGLFPVGEAGGEVDYIVLKDAVRDGVDCVGCLDAGAVSVGDSDACV